MMDLLAHWAQNLIKEFAMDRKRSLIWGGVLVVFTRPGQSLDFSLVKR